MGHEDPAQLLAWRAQIQAFLAERLRLSLTDPVAKPQLIKNGVNFSGYIVRPDYLLVRRRVVSRLKARLRDYELKLVRRRPGWAGEKSDFFSIRLIEHHGFSAVH